MGWLPHICIPKCVSCRRDPIKKACRVNYVMVVMLGRSTSYPKVRNPPTETSDLLSRFIIISQKMERTFLRISCQEGPLGECGNFRLRAYLRCETQSSVVLEVPGEHIPNSTADSVCAALICAHLDADAPQRQCSAKHLPPSTQQRRRKTCKPRAQGTHSLLYCTNTLPEDTGAHSKASLRLVTRCQYPHVEIRTK